MLGSLLTLPGEGSLLLFSITLTVDSTQRVVFAGFGERRDLHDSFICLISRASFALAPGVGGSLLRRMTFILSISDTQAHVSIHFPMSHVEPLV